MPGLFSVATPPQLQPPFHGLHMRGLEKRMIFVTRSRQVQRFAFVLQLSGDSEVRYLARSKKGENDLLADLLAELLPVKMHQGSKGNVE